MVHDYRADGKGRDTIHEHTDFAEGGILKRGGPIPYGRQAQHIDLCVKNRPDVSSMR